MGTQSDLLTVDSRGMILVNVDRDGRSQSAPIAVNHAIHTKDRIGFLQMENTMAVLGDRGRSPIEVEYC